MTKHQDVHHSHILPGLNKKLHSISAVYKASFSKILFLYKCSMPFYPLPRAKIRLKSSGFHVSVFYRWKSNTDTASKRFCSRKQSNARGNSLNTVKCTNIISAQTLVPMCDRTGRWDMQTYRVMQKESEKKRFWTWLDWTTRVLTKTSAERGGDYFSEGPRVYASGDDRWLKQADSFCSCLKTMKGPAVRRFQWCDGLVKVFTNNRGAKVMVV